MSMASLNPAPKRLFARVGQIDKVVLAFFVIVAGLALFVPGQAVDSLAFTGLSLWSIAPFFLISIGVAAYAKATGLDEQIARVFSGNPTTAVILAAGFGALSPFCSCGVIPLIAGLLKAGVPLAPVMAFWIASPLMDPEMFVLTSAVMGVDFALARTVAAIALGLGAGFATQLLMARPTFADPLVPGLKATGCGCGSKPVLRNAEVTWAFWKHDDRRATFGGEFRSAGWFLFRWLTLAFMIESLMITYIPADVVAQTLGGSEWWIVPAAALVGVPTYLNGYAAIPMVNGLLEMGMSLQAGLTFMIAGGVSSIPAAMAVFALVRRPVFAWYLALGFSGAVLAGYGYQLVLGM